MGLKSPKIIGVLKADNLLVLKNRNFIAHDILKNGKPVLLLDVKKFKTPLFNGFFHH